MGERVNKVREMIEEHEASFESLKESTTQYDEQINQYELENKQKDLHIERLIEERDKYVKDIYAKDYKALLEEYNESIQQTEQEKEENTKAREELEDKKRKLEEDVQKEMESATRHDLILRQLTQEGMQIDTEIIEVKHDMQENLYKQQTFKLEYDQEGNPTNGMELAKLDKKYKELTDQLRDLKEAKALCQEYIQKYHDELDNDMKKKWAVVQEPLKQEETNPAPANPAPANPAPANPNPAKPAPANPAPTNPNPAKPAPANPNPAKPAQANPAPTNPAPTNETPRTGETVSINDYAEKCYQRMTPNQRNDVYKYMTGQTKELGEDAKKIFDRLQELYGTDTERKIESYIKQMSAKEFLKVTGIKTDVTTGTITIDFNCGEKFKPIAADVKIYGRNGARLYSVKDAKKLAASKCEFDEIIADPYVVSAIAQATRTQLVKLGLSEEQISGIDIQKQVDLYQEALETSKDERPEDKKLDMNIEYVKSDEETPIKAGRKKFEKALRPFLREAQESAYVEIDDSIDIRTGMEKIKDALSTTWRWLTGNNKPLPAGGKYLAKNRSKEDKPKDETLTGEELTDIGRNLGIEAQINAMLKNPTFNDIGMDLTKEEQDKVNDAWRKEAEENSKPWAEEETDRDDR